MTGPLQFGQIVWVEMADANGVRKLRPAVVVTPSPQASASGPLEVVAVTSQVRQPLPADHVLLPWHPRGHPRTGPQSQVCCRLLLAGSRHCGPYSIRSRTCTGDDPPGHSLKNPLSPAGPRPQAAGSRARRIGRSCCLNGCKTMDGTRAASAEVYRLDKICRSISTPTRRLHSSSSRRRMRPGERPA